MAETNSLAEALGRPTLVTLGDKKLQVYPLDFNDMADLEERTGQSMDELDMEVFLKPVKNQRFFFWLALRKADPSLTTEQRERGEYTMTEKAAGFLLKFSTLPQQAALLGAIYSASGLFTADGDPDDADSETEGADPNAPAAGIGATESASASAA